MKERKSPVTENSRKSPVTFSDRSSRDRRGWGRGSGKGRGREAPRGRGCSGGDPPPVVLDVRRCVHLSELLTLCAFVVVSFLLSNSIKLFLF